MPINNKCPIVQVRMDGDLWLPRDSIPKYHSSPTFVFISSTMRKLYLAYGFISLDLFDDSIALTIHVPTLHDVEQLSLEV
jgi:hypothetical protein